MQTLTIIKPDDMHVHLRDGAALASLVPHLARRFARAIVMPNLQPAVTTAEAAAAYRERIVAALPSGMRFEPLMTLYLTQSTTARDVDRAKASGLIHGIKLYPAGATTHSEQGVHDLEKLYPVFEAMQACGMPLLVHGEVVDSEVDIFDRERIFIERELSPALEKFLALRCVLEHITTEDSVSFVRSKERHVAATITAHHLLYSRNALLAGGIRPHYYCAPVLKRERHRRAVLEAATSGDARFFLGSDSAPHALSAKLASCGCAGIYTGHAAIELYAEAFDSVGALDKLEAFASTHGARYYGLPLSSETITLVKSDWAVPETYPLGLERVAPLRGGETITWTIA
jgi:dihydroorotase